MPDPPPLANDICRGVHRLLWRDGVAALAEVPLPNGRRADLMGIDRGGCIVIVEIKVALADLRGDRKWPEYLDWCDRFCWAVPPALADEAAGAAYGPERAGLIVADRFDAAVVRAAATVPLAPARRRAETLRFARRAADRLLRLHDPEFGEAA